MRLVARQKLLGQRGVHTLYFVGIVKAGGGESVEEQLAVSELSSAIVPMMPHQPMEAGDPVRLLWAQLGRALHKLQRKKMRSWDHPVMLACQLTRMVKVGQGAADER